MLIRMSATPRICLRIWSSMRVKAKMAIVETTINVISIGHSRFQVTYSLSRHTINDDQLKFERVTEEAVLDLIKDDNKTLEYYRTFDSKRRDNADVVTEVLLEAGVIE